MKRSKSRDIQTSMDKVHTHKESCLKSKYMLKTHIFHQSQYFHIEHHMEDDEYNWKDNIQVHN